MNVLCETATHIYTGHANFKIEPKSISNMLQPITGTYVYTGAPQKPTAVVMDGTKTLVEGTDYTVRYGTNVHVYEAATVYVDGIDTYTGTFSPLTLPASSRRTATTRRAGWTWTTP